MNQNSVGFFMQQGQALLLVVLVLVISMTIGLSVATRSLTNVRTSTEEQDSQRAFSAAEAGIERAINSSSTSGMLASPIQIDNNTEIKALTIGQLSGNQILINNGTVISRDDGVDIWMVDHKADGIPNYTTPWNGNVTVYWGSSSDTCSSNLSDNTMAAIEVVTLTGSDTSPASHHYFFDPCTTGSPSRVSANAFDGTVSASDWTGFRYKGTISGVTNGILLRIVPLYADTRLGVKGSAALPVQGTVIESTGSSGEAQRKIVTFRGYAKLPTELFPHMLFWPQ